MYELAIPVLLLAIMTSMGMELTLDDFRRVARMPRAALVGFGGQMLMLPLVALAFAHWPGFPPAVSLGIVIVAACPGGATSNLFSYLAGANLALSITLTSLSCTVCFLTIPFWLELGIGLFMGPEAAADPIALPIGRTIGQLFGLTLLPVALGMAIRARWPQASARIRTPLRRSMSTIMVVALVGILASEWETVVRDLRAVSAGALVLVIGMLSLAYGVARASRLDRRDAFTISIEVGLQNGALASTIVISMLGRPELMVFPGAYVVISLVPVAIWTTFMRRSLGAKPGARMHA